MVPPCRRRAARRGRASALHPFLSPVGAKGRQRPTGRGDCEASSGAPGPGEKAPGGLQNRDHWGGGGPHAHLYQPGELAGSAHRGKSPRRRHPALVSLFTAFEEQLLMGISRKGGSFLRA